MAYLALSQSDKNIEVFHKAGDMLTSDSISIVVDGVDRTSEFRTQENSPGWETLKSGERLTYKSPEKPESVRIVYSGNSGQYLMASSGSEISTAPGYRSNTDPGVNAVTGHGPGSGADHTRFSV